MFKVAFIGTGADPENPGPEGYAMAYQHAPAYQKIDDCRLVGCADLVKENAENFAEEFDIDKVYTNYEKMIKELKPDIVSVCTWMEDHAEIVINLAKLGVPAIHCEKPMDLTWKNSKLMALECQKRDIKLTFNHQRRFGEPWSKAKKLLDDGEIGDLKKVQFSVGNLYEYGTHSFELCGFFNDERPAKWAIAQIDYRDENIVFGSHNENQALALWEYENGVMGLASTGKGSGLVKSQTRVVGEKGVIEVFPEDGPDLRIKRDGDEDWQNFNCQKGDYIDKAIADVVKALREDGESVLCAKNALKSTELIFACFESARRRGRVDLPLKIDDNPLETMVKEGKINPE